ncbi:MAG: succinylglutamate desuccinylase/aspartoacylase family protein [Clostridiales Family XIII bacterium]|jgi:predicted deacylase|nr:succinylglutamate desuccinylase/aspartoacylase family protein [Clostridiales Family XIII bacterium]
MKRKTLFTIDTIYRQPLAVEGLYFSEGPDAAPAVAVVGALRGDEVQQMYICSLLVGTLARLEQEGRLAPGRKILVVPCLNTFSMNIGERFWAVDNTDVNRMFPGYDKGETTQRIAAALFAHLRGFEYGVHLTSFYQRGNFIPHVRLWETGYEQAQLADGFGLPYVVHSTPAPIDTTTLGYNLQVFGTQAFSLYSRNTSSVHEKSAHRALRAILAFLAERGVLLPGSADIPEAPPDPAYPDSAAPVHLHEDALVTVLSERGGLYFPAREPGDRVNTGDELAVIRDPFTGEEKERVHAPASGHIFFAHEGNLIAGHDVCFRMIPDAATDPSLR